ncbi:putative ABC transporter ATP-binding protein YxlF [Thalassovita gelatinovora]|uniref:Putative ABC transporter ATP-binding protein YxlF n=1 Tax=Thalassovita gelatinovora TaxID=53501 RepID=A0A0P1F5K3_THAGE|nr:ABC transporter ATP-binding protein [Thalassovita gelatinovora]QIZ79569.1 ABC transporter ATP-binding protein [Thalassovita gelatinovora]CUH63049.1 putative ABC transporter ATP-binding protein YxlF [Thalassovita gelatinovora]SEQ14842.1 Cu-processing system ATP-binding protein [Thalassovita gelatinovora]
MTSTLTISHLTKAFGGVKALSDVSLSVAPGERVALLGHNGAGKSTLMKVILGLIAADGGEISVCGAAPGNAQARAHVAYLPENAAFHSALTGLEQITYYMRLRNEDISGALPLLDRVGLAHAANRRIGTYSKGMRQRVGLAQALIGHPSLLVLDEPTSGLDPVSRRDFYELLDGLAADGAAILLSSHALTEVEARTDRLLILSGGRLVAKGTLPELRREAALPVSMQIHAHETHEAEIMAALPAAVRMNNAIHLTCGQDEKLTTLAQISALQGKVADLDVIPPSLEDIYSHFSRRDGQ